MNVTTKESKKALISVFHKEGIEDFAKSLVELGYEIVSSGGTAKYLNEHGLVVTDVAKITGVPAILDHRVVTLDPKIHGGLLAKATDEHDQERQEQGIPWFDLVCVDLYPLAEAIAEGKSDQEVIEMIDIGGPTMISAARKGGRTVICDPSDRPRVVEWLKVGEPESEAFRRQLAAKADYVVSSYRLLTAKYFGDGLYEGQIGTLVVECKGENAPQSPAGLYSVGTSDPLALDKFKLLEGSALSYNNWCDVDRSLKTLTTIAAGYKNLNKTNLKIIIGVKHGNPCGVGSAVDSAEATKLMVEGDPLSLFGGLVITNFAITKTEAEILISHETKEAPKRIIDAVVAPSFTNEAMEILRRKNGACRFLENSALGDSKLSMTSGAKMLRPVRGGFLAQGEYEFILDWNSPDLEVSSELSESIKLDMTLAWAIGSRSNSNTITIVKDGQLLGNGTGQQSRVDAAKLSISRALDRGHSLAGSVAYSDSFFPFPDGPLTLTDAGVTAIFATRGSVNDEKVAKAVTDTGATLATLPDSLARGFFGH
jgi:phosphoribosylaminoimidazolecarboxamide formyltransferase/IMP cyclohydrolase